MLLIRQYQIFAFLILVSINLLSQQQGSNFPGGIITGKVIDSSTKHTIEYANVVVFSLKDSTMVTGGVTDSSGLFKLSINKPGNFKIEVRFIGYDTEIIRNFDQT